LPGAYAVRRPVVNAYLVRQRDRRRLRELGAVVAVIVPIGVALLGYTWLQLETLRTGYRIESLEREAHRLTQVERQLRLEAAHQAHPARLARRAADELGLAPPAVEQVLFLEEIRWGSR
jgi:4-amino-4-deoxy-L-arabinose transferase-like glycosyltransferase